MKGPDYAGGIRSILNEMKQREMLKEAKAQKEFENILEVGKLGVQQTEAGTKATAEERLGKQFDIEKDYIPYKQLPAHAAAVKWLMDVEAYDSPREASDALKGIKSVEQLEAEAEAKAKGAGTGKFAPPKPTKPTAYDLQVQAAKRQLDAGQLTQEQFNQIEVGLTQKKGADELKLQKDSMKLLMARLNKEREILAKSWDAATNDKEKKIREFRLLNVENALAKLDAFNTKLIANTPLSKEELTQAAQILTNINRIKEGKYDLESNQVISPESMEPSTIDEKMIPAELKSTIGVNPQTGERGLYINGKWTIIKKK